MKIAIVGAPGSGKTAFAKKLSKELGLPVFDNEAQKFAKKANVIVGFGVDYRTEIMLLGERIQNALKNWEQDGIFTQTLLDSVAYQHLRNQFAQKNILVKIEDQDVIIENEKEKFLTALFAEIFIQSFNFDKIYHLKMFDDVEKPVEEGKFHLYKLVEAAHTDVLNMFVNGESVETIKRPAKVRRGSVAKD